MIRPNKSKNSFHLHLVSDSTGETLESMAAAALAQFEQVDVNKHFWPMIRTPRQMERIMQDIEEAPGLIMYTLVNDDIRRVLSKKSKKLGIPSISILTPVIDAFHQYFGVEAHALPGRQHALNAKYFERIEALDYTLTHDDGQATQDLRDADIILVGVSRTSKTPTSIYLANKGFRTANVPFVPECPLPEDLGSDLDGFVVGLTITPDRLVQIRANRLRAINHDTDTDYVDIDAVKQEIAACRRLCSDHGWPVIDVTRRSIEETAAAILNHYHAWQEEKQKNA